MSQVAEWRRYRGRDVAVRAPQFGGRCRRVVPLISEKQKFCLPSGANQQFISAIPFQLEGRFAIVTNAERVVVDTDAPLTNGA